METNRHATREYTLLQKVMLWLSKASAPNRNKVFAALDALYHSILTEPGKKGNAIPFNPQTDKYIIFSDMHKGANNWADDFTQSRETYLLALDYYFNKGYHLVALGDSEELLENTLEEIIEVNRDTFLAEKRFLQHGRFTKIFGNHDIHWENSLGAKQDIERLYGPLDVQKGMILTLQIEGAAYGILLTHGHQGDALSDGNWLSKWFLRKIWAPMQNAAKLHPNSITLMNELKTAHNTYMYEWVARQENLLLVTGHTHQPVFMSLTHLERLYAQLEEARLQHNHAGVAAITSEINKRKKMGAVAPQAANYKPRYFNTGCCCYHDGDLTGIELSGGNIALVHWQKKENELKCLYSVPLQHVFEQSGRK